MEALNVKVLVNCALTSCIWLCDDYKDIKHIVVDNEENGLS